MSAHYISRGEPIAIAASTTTTTSYQNLDSIGSLDIVVPTGGTPVKVAVFQTGGTSPGNIVVPPGESKVTAPLGPSGVPANCTILVTAIYGSGNVYITPIASLPH